MPSIFRAVRNERGVWECRHGTAMFDTHTDAESAMGHLRRLAAILALTPAVIVLQSQDDEVLAVSSTLGESAFDFVPAARF